LTKKYIILNLNPGYDQYHVIRQNQPAMNVNRADEVYRAASGKGLNIARAMHNLGSESYVCINVLGGCLGKLIMQLTRREGIICREFHIKEEARINTCIIDEYKKETVSYNAPGPQMSPVETEQFLEFMKQILFGQEASVVLSGAPCRGITEEGFRQLMGLVHEHHHRLIVDIAGKWLKMAVEYPIHILKVNREEFQEAFQLDAFIFNNSLKRFKETKGIDILIVTDGANGSVAYDNVGHRYQSFLNNLNGGICAVGSGDAFLGGFIKMEEDGANFKKCISYANACGTANTFCYLPADIKNEEIETYEKYVVVKQI